MKIRNLIPFALILSMATGAQSNSTKLSPERLGSAIERAKQNIRDLKLARKGPKGENWEYWDRPSRLGLQYSSQYYLILKWLAFAGIDRDSFGTEKPETLKNLVKLKYLIMKTRLPDGSWYAIKDANLVQTTPFKDLKGLKPENLKGLSKDELESRGIVSFNNDEVRHYKGDLNATIFHYWTLKVMAADESDRLIDPRASNEQMEDSRNFIVRQGGIDKSVLFTKVFLALFGNYPWKFIPYIPMALFYDLPRKTLVKDFSQWVIPHLKPMAYMIHYGNDGGMTPKNLPESYALNELYVEYGKAKPNPQDALPEAMDRAFKLIGKFDIVDNYAEYSRNLVENVLMNEQKAHGSWGAYTLSTLFTILVLNDYSKGKASRGIEVSPELRKKIRGQILRGFAFIEKLFFDSGESSFFGVLDDGSYWDTALMAQALLENDEKPENLRKVADFLAHLQQDDGGFPFGYDFDTYTDVDDTATILQVLSYLPGYDDKKRKGLAYFRNMQNRNGGWAAFDRDNVGNPFIKFGSKQTADSADLFDESSPDVTGHVLSYLGVAGLTKNDPSIKAGVIYLANTAGKPTQGLTAHHGIWDARWAINFFFGTEAAVSGLRAVGYHSQHGVFDGAGDWFFPAEAKDRLQNKDGGYGESSASYAKTSAIGRGVSTASQTAWALSILAELDAHEKPEALGAVEFLIQQIEKDLKFSDRSVTGTGHPNVIYMEYPSYPMTFPLIALAKYLRGACRPMAKEKIFDGRPEAIEKLCAPYTRAALRYTGTP